jgi:hypothetical protein
MLVASVVEVERRSLVWGWEGTAGEERELYRQLRR